MINAPQLLLDLKRRLTLLEADLRSRMGEVPEMHDSLAAEWQAARDAGRCAETFETWAEQVLTQAAVHWLLSCVFLRFIEDNALVDRPFIAGPFAQGRLALARDRYEAYFRQHPLHTDREYLLECFAQAGKLAGLATFFDAAHNPVFRLGISGDAAMALRQFWQQQDPASAELVHDFTDAGWNTRFLGDLYQDLSEATRKRYALLQTPEFVEEFILDRTLTPALHEFGYKETRMIDPTCGSGHFLLGGFARMVAQWTQAEPGRNSRSIAQMALDAVAGVDLNPFAVAITRFRLLLAALQASGVARLADAPDFKIHVAIGDSLLHGTRFGLKDTQDMFQTAEDFQNTGLEHAYASEDLDEVKKILGRQYHAVVGNPPYIVVKDAALNAAYRKLYASCHRQYSLGAPFTERFFELALTGGVGGQSAGFVGLITANSFMKREFGSKLIEEVLPKLDLTHVIDTAGAYIPGHGTPTVILFGRHRLPVTNQIRTVMGIKGEPSTPANPAQGQVWSAIIRQINAPGSESVFVSVSDTNRSLFSSHPWSIGGGGAAELRDAIDSNRDGILGEVAKELGFGIVTREDEVYVQGSAALKRVGIEPEFIMPSVEGENVRDWSFQITTGTLWPYDQASLNAKSSKAIRQTLWPFRAGLSGRVAFGLSQIGRGLEWFEYSMFFRKRFVTPLTISFAEIATHNHFILDRGNKIFNRTAPVIKLPAGATEEIHHGLVGLLNSSTACFWLKQVCHNKGSTVDQHGARQRTSPFEDFYALNSTKIAEFPLVKNQPGELATQIDAQAQQITALLPAARLAADLPTSASLPTRASLDSARAQVAALRRQMIALQEELDWQCYRLYELLPAGSTAQDFESPAPPEIALGERAFEIVLARRMAAGTETTTWFDRHGSTPITELPAHWPTDYRALVQRRIDLIERDRNIALIERPEYKRRWNTPSWESLEQAALRDWLLARLETERYWPRAAPNSSEAAPAQLISTAKLAELARQDADFMQVAELFSGHADFDPAQLVAELVTSEAVPVLPAQRYTEPGLRKRAQWQATWDMQRHEDQIDFDIDRLQAQARADRLASNTDPDKADYAAYLDTKLPEEFAQQRTERKEKEVGKIPVPPKYQSKDFQKTDFWRLRGALDVPKERWSSLPGCERSADGSLVVGWAGWGHLQLATAIAGYYMDRKEQDGWPPERLLPLIAALQELLPWLKQWHNEVHPAYGERMGSYYASFVEEEARALGSTLEGLRNWQPAVVAKTRKKKGTA
jgi:hypothetical protein